MIDFIGHRFPPHEAGFASFLAVPVLPLSGRENKFCLPNDSACSISAQNNIMDEIVNLVAQRTGLSPEDSQKAVEAVIGIIKSRVPAPLAAHLDSLIAGGMSGEMGTLENEAGEMLKGKLGGLFGKT